MTMSGPADKLKDNAIYQNKSNLDLASAQYFNQGLEEKQLCVYASVYCSDKSHLSIIISPNLYSGNVHVSTYYGLIDSICYAIRLTSTHLHSNC